jgi:uncharacterized protein YbcI
VTASQTPLHGGELLTAISTRLVGLMREHYGRGPVQAKTYAFDDVLLCILRDDGSLPVEQTLLERGEPDRVVELRQAFQRLMEPRYREEIERLSGRKVLALLGQTHVEPNVTVELFLMDGPVGGPAAETAEA